MAKIRLTLPLSLLSDFQIALLQRCIEGIVRDLFLGKKGGLVNSEVRLQDGATSVVIKVSDDREQSMQVPKLKERIRFVCTVFGFVPASVTFAPIG